MEQQDGTPDGDLRQQIEALRADRDAALAQKAALAEILVAINASAGDSKPVFDLILEKAHLLCGAEVGSLGTFDGQYFRKVARHGYNTAIDVVLNQPYPAGTEHAPLLRGETLHVHDAFTYPWPEDARAHSIAYFIKGGLRTWLEVPMFKDGRLIGTLSGFRRQARPFSEREISLLESFSTQAVLAMENARLITEQREALEQQTATAEVLAVINASPGNLAPVFDSMLEKAMRLCEAAFGTLFIRDGKIFRSVAARGVPAAYAEFRAKTIMTPRPDSLLGKIMETKSVLHVLDIIDSEYYRGGTVNLRAVADLGGARTILHVPLMKDSEVLGVIVVYRQEVRAFTDKQIPLLENFAAQAVIAMENARLITETREALEQQTATAEVLGVINASPGNLAPVFDAILDKAMRVCGVAFGSLNTWDGDLVRNVANRGLPPALAEWQDRNPVRKAGAAALRSIETKRSQQLLDTMEEDGYKSGQPAPRAVVDLGGARTSLFVPLIKDESTLGFLHLFRQEVRAFTDKEIALLENFAAQAVLAMENARLITETREALEQQTATAEVLGVINASPGKLAPVFEAMLEKAMRLCGFAFGMLRSFDGTRLETLASRGVPAAFAAFTARNPITPRSGTSMSRALELGRAEMDLDIKEVEAYKSGIHTIRAVADLGGARTILHVPLVKDGVSIGLFTIYRQEVLAFTDKQITLLQNFAAQAVIAMENARLITEQREALEQQTATAEVLGVINANPGNLMPVFDSILEKAHRICDATIGALVLYENDRVSAAATRGFAPEHMAVIAGGFPPTPGHTALIQGDALYHIADLQAAATPAIMASAVTRSLIENMSIRTVLHVPLRRHDVAIGAITAYRLVARPFSEKEITLLENFAAQAVIAMENARLITEQREALEQQTATAEVLGVINASPGNLVPVFDAMLEKAMRLCGAAFGVLDTWDGARRKAVATRGLPDALAAFMSLNPETWQVTPMYAELLETKQPAHRLDVMAGEAYGQGHPVVRALCDLGGARTFLIVPLLKDGAVLGNICVYRQEVRAFTDKQIALLENFAAQAVIAMENARLLNEIRTARDEAETTLADLRRTQDRLVQTEKMASLGQLTAGIAHEIKNPLNFVNNFSDLSVDLLDELNMAVAPGKIEMPEDTRAEIDEITATLKGNLQKIAQHGRRADSIVKNMLLHSRSGASEHRAVDLNAVAEEALNLAYHGARAETPGFNITMEKDLDPGVGMVEVYPQEISRVLVNLINNGFYAAHKQAEAILGFEPILRLSTKNLGDQVEIRVRDNGTGIPADVRAKIFEPFFTTKPAGQGTGLGLSLSFDIVVKQHGGQLGVASETGVFTEFTVTLPRRLPENEGSQT